jgi:hypothetical protein
MMDIRDRGIAGIVLDDHCPRIRANFFQQVDDEAAGRRVLED